MRELVIMDGMRTQHRTTRHGFILLCACALAMCGCFTKRMPAKPMIGAAAFQHPVMPPALEATLEPAPNFPFEGAVAPAQLVSGRSAPPKPHVVQSREPEPMPAEKAGEPIIAPELTTAESETARAETQHNLNVVERNLTLAWGRKLNAGQQDLASKIRGFTDGAREAMRSSDWVRAKNLSKKAVVLSEQLAASL